MLKVPKIENEINEKDVEKSLAKNFEKVVSSWLPFQLIWLNNSYSKTKDHEKWLIVIYIISKVVNFYSRNLINYTLEEYNRIQNLEIKDLKIIEISKTLNLKKETTRRKINELQKEGFLKKNKKNITVLSSPKNFPGTTTQKSTEVVFVLCTLIAKVLYEKKILKKIITKKEFKEHIEKNFTYYLKNFYDMQIKVVIIWKDFFKDLDLFHVFGVCVNNRNYDFKKINYSTERIEFIKNFLSQKGHITGISAMSISEISGIPRATVVRKLNILTKRGFLSRDNNKLYSVNNKNYSELEKIQKKILKHLSIFITKTINRIII